MPVSFFIIIFMFVFGPIVKSPFGSFGDLSLWIAVVFFVWAALSSTEITAHLSPFCWTAFSISLLAAVSSLVITDQIDVKYLQVILRPVRGLIIFIGLYFAVYKMSLLNLSKEGPKRVYDAILHAIYLSTVVHGLLIVAQFIFPSVRDLTYSILLDQNVLEFNKQFRMPGLAGAGGAHVSAAQGFGFFLGVHLALSRNRYMPYLLGNLVLVISFILTGRTGFILAGLSGAYYILSVVTNRRFAEQINRRLFAIVVLFIATCFAIGWASSSLIESYDNPMLLHAVERTFESYYNYTETGKFSDRTMTSLKDMLQFPDKPSILIGGDVSQYDNVSADYVSDIGYVRILWGYGLLGLTGHVIFYLLLGWLVSSQRVRAIMGKENVFLALWILAAVFVLNCKEIFFFSRLTYQITLFVVVSVYVVSRLPISTVGQVCNCTAEAE